MTNNIQYMLSAKRGKNDYLPININDLKSSKENLNTLEEIDKFTSNTNESDLLNEILKKSIIAPDDYFMYFTIIYKEKGRFREIKDGVIYENIKEAINDNIIIELINNNYTDKKLINYITNLLTKNIEQEINQQLIFILKNIEIFEEKGKNAIKAALSKYSELPYKEKRSISINIIKKYQNLL